MQPGPALIRRHLARLISGGDNLPGATVDDPYAAALEATIRGLQRDINRLRDDIKDEQSMTRGYRRLLIECLRRSRACPTCNPPQG